MWEPSSNFDNVENFRWALEVVSSAGKIFVSFLSVYEIFQWHFSCCEEFRIHLNAWIGFWALRKIY